MLVRNYGLFWSEQRVHWGHPGHGNDGQINGVPERHRTEKFTNFRDQIAIYVLYRAYRIVYVGQTGSGDQRLFNRLRHHRRDHLKDRWDSFSWFELIPVNATSRKLRANFRVRSQPADVLNHVEAILTAVCEPPLNLQRGRFGDAEAYLQAEDERLPFSPAEMLEEALERLEAIEKLLAEE